ncbi:Rad52/Rad22 family DNA repair protein [Thermovibrio ammonificans]|uniref:Rad52/22 double-strand break repair protein n=1 Tax=Thermovibrio ammonificans (strain DSM 15698 / JCM 12110 / HB-1) TaxID=648996 RepID=E8T2U2_THEA1|nr:Rad52/Rad22 family DNA repair protein [Thermovibrio ammonificans]ADU97151.1 hypothetical protein Theam_1187 [Thermovibrio ammonificans HB-1]
MEKNYWTQVVEKIDKILENEGEKAIQEVPGRGRTLYGYRPQFVIDAINRVLGAHNWGYEVLEQSVTETTGKKGEKKFLAWAKVKVWVGKPESAKVAFGGSENYTPGDALKGATTDAVQKGLSLFSIGRKAYRGELKELLPQQNGPKASEKQLKLIKQLADEVKFDLSEVNLKNLSQTGASQLIKELLSKRKAG